jgi:hypothetical protein
MLVAGAQRSERDPGGMSIIAHRDADALKMAERVVEFLLREKDLGARFRWAVRNGEEVGEREEGMDPCVQA